MEATDTPSERTRSRTAGRRLQMDQPTLVGDRERTGRRERRAPNLTRTRRRTAPFKPVQREGARDRHRRLSFPVHRAPPGGRACPPGRGVAEGHAARFRSLIFKCHACRAGANLDRRLCGRLAGMNDHPFVFGTIHRSTVGLGLVRIRRSLGWPLNACPLCEGRG